MGKLQMSIIGREMLVKIEAAEATNDTQALLDLLSEALDMAGRIVVAINSDEEYLPSGQRGKK